jgi:hypothetical protein
MEIAVIAAAAGHPGEALQVSRTKSHITLLSARLRILSRNGDR